MPDPEVIENVRNWFGRIQEIRRLDENQAREEDAQLVAGERWEVGQLAPVIRFAPHRWDEALEKANGKMTGKRGEELFHLILSGIREVYDVDPAIAGGAVRDVAAGVTDHKDVDVFIPLDFQSFLRSVDQLGWSGKVHVVKSFDDYGKDNKKVPCSFKALARAESLVQGCKIDLIFMDKPLTPEIVDKFPVHAQRGVWTLGGGINLSPLAKHDIDNKTFTIDPTITDKDVVQYIKEKIAGWKRRVGYKDWKLVEPVIKEWWEEKEKSDDDIPF